MGLKVTGTRQLFTAPKGEKGDKGEDGNSFTPKGQAKGHFNSSDEFYEDSSEKPYGSKYLVDDEEGGTAKVYTIAIRRIGIADANEGDAYTIVTTKHLWAATGHEWVDFGEIQGPKGDDGDDAELYKLQLTEGWARWEKYGSGWRLKCCIKGNAWFIRGGTQMSATSGTGYEEQRIRIRYNNNKQLHFEPIAGDGSWTDDVEGKYLENDEYDSSSVGQPECIIVELIGKDISDHTQVLDALTITIAWDGEPGGKGGDGDPGPMGIPAGAYNSSARYERTSEIVPIVEHKGEYWFPRNKGVLTNSEPSANNNDWKKAENFEVMFVKILFAAFAKLGEAIFHGRYMFSQNGKVNGEASNNYKLFSPEDPDNEENASRFAPNLYLDFLAGAARMAAGKVKFNADGSGFLAGGKINWNTQTIVNIEGYINALGGTFRGKVIADLFYSPIKVLPQGNYTIDPETEPAHTYMDGQTTTEVTLPNAETYMGLELAFFHYIGSRMSGPGELKLKGRIIKGQDEYGMGVMRLSAYVKPGVIVKLFAMNDFWYLTSGELLDEPFF